MRPVNRFGPVTSIGAPAATTGRQRALYIHRRG
jgi:hypothetical protein